MGDSVSSLAHGFLWLGRTGSHDVGYGGGVEHMLLSAGLRRAFAMCGLPSAVCLTPRERSTTGWMRPTDTWAAAGGGSLTRTHNTHTESKEKLSLLLAGLSEEKELGLQGGQLSVDSASPPLCGSLGSLLNQGLAVCLFG